MTGPASRHRQCLAASPARLAGNETVRPGPQERARSRLMTGRWIWLVPSKICMVVDRTAVSAARRPAAGGWCQHGFSTGFPAAGAGHSGRRRQERLGPRRRPGAEPMHARLPAHRQVRPASRPRPSPPPPAAESSYTTQQRQHERAAATTPHRNSADESDMPDQQQGDRQAAGDHAGCKEIEHGRMGPAATAKPLKLQKSGFRGDFHVGRGKSHALRDIALLQEADAGTPRPLSCHVEPPPEQPLATSGLSIGPVSAAVGIP